MRSVTISTLLAGAAAIVPTAGAIAVDTVPFDRATPFVAEDGTEIYCVFDVERNEEGTIVGLHFTDCPDPTTLTLTSGDSGGDGDAIPTQKVDNLKVGDSFVNYFLNDEQTTVTLERAVSGVPTRRWARPGKAMTTLALFFRFEANENGGQGLSVEAFSPDGDPFDRNRGVMGRYEQEWTLGDIRPDKATQGWIVFDVPKKGKVEVVVNGYDARTGENLFATYVVQP